MREYRRLPAQGLILLAGFLLAACGAGPQKGASSFTFAGDEIVHPIAEALINAYEEDNPGVSGSYRQLPAPLLNDFLAAGVIDFALTLNEKGGGNFSTPIGYDHLLPMVNAENPTDAIALDDLRTLLAGEGGDWHAYGGHDCDADLIAFPESYAMAEAVGAMVLIEADFAPSSRLAMTAEEAIQLLKVAPCGLTLLPAFYARAGIRGIPIRVAVGAEWREQTLSLPIYWVSNEEPDGEAGKFLAWLLSDQGQTVIGTMISGVR